MICKLFYVISPTNNKKTREAFRVDFGNARKNRA